jgi:hypothetical protein
MVSYKLKPKVTLFEEIIYPVPKGTSTRGAVVGAISL